MTGLVRVPGQVPALPGAVRAGATVWTSGVIAPSALAAMAGGAAPDFAAPDFAAPDFSAPDFSAQAVEALTALLAVLADAGAGPADVVRLEAFLADAADFPAWNRAFTVVWPVPGPARTTLVSGFVDPAVRIEVQAVAVLT